MEHTEDIEIEENEKEKLQSLKEKLEAIAEENKYDNPLKAYVALYPLDLYEDDEIKMWFEDVLRHGCSGGFISELIYYKDTYAFFDKYYEDIEELRIEAEENIGAPLDLKDNLKNTLAWFGFEETAFQISNELELEI